MINLETDPEGVSSLTTLCTRTGVRLKVPLDWFRLLICFSVQNPIDMEIEDFKRRMIMMDSNNERNE